MLFATFTAPSFGPVHAHRRSGDTVYPCRPRRSGKCPHVIPLSCWRRHEHDDEIVGQPLCPRCFDYEAEVLWNALAPELFRRTMQATSRVLADLGGISTRCFGQVAKLNYFKVAELQKRGAIHYHAVVRLDGPEPSSSPPGRFTVELLERALSEAVARTTSPCPLEGLAGRWGDQLECRRMTGDGGPLSSARVAGYVAKYATKSCASYWDVCKVDHEDDVGRLGVPEHIRSLVRAAWRLGGRERLHELKLRKNSHKLGYRGHWSSKSRCYSTSFRKLRRARRSYVRAKLTGSAVPLDAWGRPQSEDLCEVVPTWRYVGRGFKTSGEEFLALQAAARSREHRRLAWEELRAVTGDR